MGGRLATGTDPLLESTVLATYSDSLDKAYDDHASRHSHLLPYPRYSLHMHVTAMIPQVKGLILVLSEQESQSYRQSRKRLPYDDSPESLQSVDYLAWTTYVSCRRPMSLADETRLQYLVQVSIGSAMPNLRSSTWNVPDRPLGVGFIAAKLMHSPTPQRVIPPDLGSRSEVRTTLGFRFGNDPSAGSPTETLLRLLLPLNDKVQWTSATSRAEPPTSPRSNTSPDHSIGRSDGRLPGPVGQGYRLVEYISVARVRPRTSKGITDLLLPQTFRGLKGRSPSKKLAAEGYLRIAS
ncbi:UNVERIFIED_CONTAM: hypothetical protein Scaly_2640500 [Sesamum calycinum]|uniref:Uncharacterized protein n=1 Tax=Sesamum calycinum TaxID=2727403 RepID=A0AAW2JB18_9LAMI